MAATQPHMFGVQQIDGSWPRLVDISAGNDVTTYTDNEAILAIYVGSAGNVKVDDMAGTAVTFTAVPTGTTITGKFKKVYATGTTASAMIGYQKEAAI